MKSMIISLVLASTSGIICYLVAGNSLDLFIGCFFFAAILAGQLPGEWGTIAGITIGIGLCWWMPVHADAITATQWGMCVALLASFVAAMVMLVRALQRFSPAVASTVVTVVALAWLSWPVWLSASIPGIQLRGSVLFHPLFAINHVVSDLGIWTEQQAAYSLTTLGQDVAYQLPFSAWPTIAMQSGLAIALAILTMSVRHSRSVSPEVISSLPAQP